MQHDARRMPEAAVGLRKNESSYIMDETCQAKCPVLLTLKVGIAGFESG
jgi:hypothetical protein